MYRQAYNSVQREQREETVRFKQNLIFHIFVAVAVGVLLSFYFDIVAGTLLMGGACLVALLTKKRHIAIVILFLLLSFGRAYTFNPTHKQMKNALNMGMPKIDVVYAKYDFLFQNEMDFIRGIPQRIIGEDGSYVAGIMFGEKSDINKETTEAFKKAGITHILSVSGLHAGAIMSALCFVLKKVKSKIRLPILYLALMMMVALSSFSPPVIRSAIMMGIFLFADTFGYRYNLLNSLMLSGVIILLASPYTIFDVGFILSFTATLGIPLFYSHLYDRLKRVGKYLGSGIAMYISCQLTTLPIMIVLFEEISLLGVLGNLLTVPLVTASLVMGMIGLILYPIGLSYLPFFGSAYLMKAVEYIAKLIGDVPFSLVEIGSVSLIVVLCYYLIIGVYCDFVFESRKRINLSLVTAVAVVLILGFIAV